MFILKIVGKKNDEMRFEVEGVDEKGVLWLFELKYIIRVIEIMSGIFIFYINILCFF